MLANCLFKYKITKRKKGGLAQFRAFTSQPFGGKKFSGIYYLGKNNFYFKLKMMNANLIFRLHPNCVQHF